MGGCGDSSGGKEGRGRERGGWVGKVRWGGSGVGVGWRERERDREWEE